MKPLPRVGLVLCLWSAASMVGLTAAESVRIENLPGLYNITKITEGSTCHAAGPHFTWEFDQFRGTLRTFHLQCPDSEFHVRASPPKFIQRVTRIQRLGLDFEVPDPKRGVLVEDPLYERQITYKRIVQGRDCFFAATAIYWSFRKKTNAPSDESTSESFLGTSPLLKRLRGMLCTAYKGLVERYNLSAVPVLEPYRGNLPR
ncbi:hypothetical protein FOZ61_009312 [Perkinsus olseni]|uniref:Uncharacterized protein n=1 Tax=Perkinsus olseni TaxID=32597 RepID=A0A7J6MP82_PEROL|nr:hypothetical protein FOZ61_009312 [Perkinsus olseni]KAF4673196.1 hypothetical protein FOL46_007689 [Perkinsus olseni]